MMNIRLMLILSLHVFGKDCDLEIDAPTSPENKVVEVVEVENPPTLLLPEKIDLCSQDKSKSITMPVEVHAETRTVVKEVVVEVDEPKESVQSKIEPVASYKPQRQTKPATENKFPMFNRYHRGWLGGGTSERRDRCYVLMMNSRDADISKIVSLIESSGGKIKRYYSKNGTGVSFCSSNEEIYKKIKSENLPADIEEDQIYRTSSLQTSIPNHMYLMKHYENIIFNNYFYDNWVFRLLQIKRILRSFFGFYEYYYTGRGVNIFLLDTTVSVTSGNVQNLSGSREACNRHGNTMAGLLIGKTHGFAKNSYLSVLDVVGCNGRVLLSDVLYGLENIEKGEFPRMLVFGISGLYSRILNSIVDSISNSGVIVVAPAGNFHDQSCSYSPGSAKSVINVGSVNKHARISSFSNYGDCVRIFTLGESLFDGDDAAGTSFSAAIVASAIGIFLEKFPRSTFVQVWKYLNQNSFWSDKGAYSTMKMPYLGIKSTEPGEQSFFNLTEFQENLVTYVFIIAVIFGVAYLIFLAMRHVKRMRREEDLLFDAPVNRF